MIAPLTDAREWLEADRSGGFAMGAASGIRARRYHALLTAATRPPAGRVVLVSGAEVWVEEGESHPVFLSSHRYATDVVHPDGHQRLVEFTHQPWPTWTYAIDERRTIVHEIVCEPASGDVVLAWRLEGGGTSVALCVRLLLAARDYHSLQRENGEFCFDASAAGAGNIAWQPYDARTAVTALTNGAYRHDPAWYRQFSYEQERRRGLDHVEDLASPGVFRFALGGGAAAAMVLRAGCAPYGDARGIADNVRASERVRRARFAGPLQRAADAYLVRRGDGLTVIAGYPWFTDWGRDTFISVRGMCLASGRVDDARRVLLAWADTVSDGMLPNRFTDAGEAPEYNSVDASLWFAVVVGELLNTGTVPPADQRRLLDAVGEIARGYTRGTRYGIRCDEDGLLAAGVPGMQLTWMDAKIGDWVVTPRIGKPVEIQALWINALAVAERLDPAFARQRERALASFRARFPCGDGSLYDVVDTDHVRGKDDASFRPNQIFAAGGLPIALIDGAEARALVDAVEARLWTPAGLRTLAPDDPAYRARCDGSVSERDSAYHQGTVWPWLAGPFVDAWLRVRGGSDAARAEAWRRFVAPLCLQLNTAGLGHLFEIADGDAPHTPRGAPFQAWSLAELLRIRCLVGVSS